MDYQRIGGPFLKKIGKDTCKFRELESFWLPLISFVGDPGNHSWCNFSNFRKSASDSCLRWHFQYYAGHQIVFSLVNCTFVVNIFLLMGYGSSASQFCSWRSRPFQMWKWSILDIPMLRERNKESILSVDATIGHQRGLNNSDCSIKAQHLLYPCQNFYLCIILFIVERMLHAEFWACSQSNYSS